MAASYILGPFRLDAETDTLFRSGEPVLLGRRAVALLRVLVEQRGTPVSKDALMDAAWDDAGPKVVQFPDRVRDQNANPTSPLNRYIEG